MCYLRIFEAVGACAGFLIDLGGCIVRVCRWCQFELSGSAVGGVILRDLCRVGCFYSGGCIVGSLSGSLWDYLFFGR